MSIKADFVFPYSEEIENSFKEIKNDDLSFFFMSKTETEIENKILISNLWSKETFQKILDYTNSELIILGFDSQPIRFIKNGLARLLNIAAQTEFGILYSDYLDDIEAEIIQHPLCDYQLGSIRDDFDFGKLVVIKREHLQNLIVELDDDSKYSAWYQLRLLLSEKLPVVRIPEYLYISSTIDFRTSGEKQFDYVNPKNRDVQIEMEKVAANHLKRINAWLPKVEKEIELSEGFEIEATVVIPVKDRATTVGMAIDSVLKQETNFNFNIIVVDNFSSDGTTEVLIDFSERDKRVIHHIPDSTLLGIGGCWNEAVNHPECGKFAIQLDSDDMYKDASTLQTIVNKFYEEKCAMVIGSYQITDFELNELPPGLIDHKEWTDENGHNNALRLNGLGAPRAFYTPVIRKIGFPNVSYGEDYSAAIRISREYKLGRIYESLYMCRRWQGNTDANLDIASSNKNNTYKDRLRTLEILARQKMNSEG